MLPSSLTITHITQNVKGAPSSCLVHLFHLGLITMEQHEPDDEPGDIALS